MASADALTTFHNPLLSLMQSALQETQLQQPEDVLPRSMEPPPTLMDQFLAADQAASAPAPKDLLRGPQIPVARCAALLRDLVWADIRDDEARAQTLRDELAYSHCDPAWVKAYETYTRYRLARDRAPIPYRRHASLGDFILPIPERCVIGIIGDWGSGTATAQWVLSEVMRHKPDVLIHLGDIYYCATEAEVRRNFLDIVRRIAPHVPTYTLCGNHDVYSGGAGYYWLLAQLGQPASYFGLRNASWQLLGLDTGLHDNNPFTVFSNASYLEASEVAWHRDKIEHAGGRRTILLSHHQLLSLEGAGQDSDGKLQAFNPHLANAFQDLLGSVALWLWGHEHSMLAFQPYLGLQRGRCVGAGAMPVFYKDGPPTPAARYNLQGQSALPALQPARLKRNGDSMYFHGYATLSLDGPGAQMAYYQLDASARGQSELLFEETI